MEILRPYVRLRMDTVPQVPDDLACNARLVEYLPENDVMRTVPRLYHARGKLPAKPPFRTFSAHEHDFASVLHKAYRNFELGGLSRYWHKASCTRTRTLVQLLVPPKDLQFREGRVRHLNGSAKTTVGEVALDHADGLKCLLDYDRGPAVTGIYGAPDQSNNPVGGR